MEIRLTHLLLKGHNTSLINSVNAQKHWCQKYAEQQLIHSVKPESLQAMVSHHHQTNTRDTRRQATDVTVVTETARPSCDWPRRRPCLRCSGSFVSPCCHLCATESNSHTNSTDQPDRHGGELPVGWLFVLLIQQNKLNVYTGNNGRAVCH
ncbi:hypothetical protein AMECASPLE_014851 [Ameca splendens]|uniref:Uncharacterized protein n=1 Tax=Ameca splendens TaxID=208324 RepID=A0ABV1A921_9TELE